MIPEFEKSGNLPPGVHNATIDDIKERFGINPHRQSLIVGLDRVLLHLKEVGCLLVYLDGSFVTSKEYPNDYDLCWSIIGISEEQSKKIDPILIDIKNHKKEMKEKYLGDIFPAEVPEGNTGKLFRNFFQIDKNTGEDKGIIAINLN